MKTRRFSLRALFLLLALQWAFVSVEASDHNLTSNALGGALGLFNLEYSYKLAEHATLGVLWANGTGKLGKAEVSGNSYGLVTRYYLLPALEKSSWYLIATWNKWNYKFTVKDSQDVYTSDQTPSVLAAGAGYHWFWESFNISLGLLCTNQSGIKLTNSSGEVYGDSWDPRFGLDFTIGGKF